MIDPSVVKGTVLLGIERAGELMSANTPSRSEIEAWRPRQLRATFFATPDALPLKPGGWWGSVMNGSPDRVEERPKVGHFVAEGPFLDGVLTISVHANRIDWGLDTLIDDAAWFEGKLAIGSFPTVRDEFLARVLRWLPSAPPCHRAAFGGRLLLPVLSREEGYRLLASYLPFAPDPEGSTDLRYQINRQRRSGVQPGLLIHRLQAWSVSSVRVVSVPPGERLPLSGSAETFSISLEPDVNTDAEFFDRLPPERIVDLIKELAQFATELALQGDCP
jgi:hypothetical protein